MQRSFLDNIVTRVELISLEAVKMQALIANTNLETGDHQLAVRKLRQR